MTKAFEQAKVRRCAVSHSPLWVAYTWLESSNDSLWRRDTVRTAGSLSLSFSNFFPFFSYILTKSKVPEYTNVPQPAIIFLNIKWNYKDTETVFIIKTVIIAIIATAASISSVTTTITEPTNTSTATYI